MVVVSCGDGNEFEICGVELNGAEVLMYVVELELVFVSAHITCAFSHSRIPV